MKKIILGTIFLFSSVIFAQVDSTQVNPESEYQESSFQGDPETPLQLFTLDISNVYGTWKSSKNGIIWNFRPNKTFTLTFANDPVPLDGFWNLENNYINVHNPDKNDPFSAKLLVKDAGKDVLSVNEKGTDFELVRVNNTKSGVINKTSATTTTTTKPKRKVNSPLPIMEKNIVGKWQATNGTIFLFTYGYLKMSPRNQRMIDCHWALDNGYIVTEVLGQILMKPQVISVSKTKMILAMDGGDVILTKL